MRRVRGHSDHRMGHRKGRLEQSDRKLAQRVFCVVARSSCKHGSVILRFVSASAGDTSVQQLCHSSSETKPTFDCK